MQWRIPSRLQAMQHEARNRRSQCSRAVPCNRHRSDSLGHLRTRYRVRDACVPRWHGQCRATARCEREYQESRGSRPPHTASDDKITRTPTRPTRALRISRFRSMVSASTPAAAPVERSKGTMPSAPALRARMRPVSSTINHEAAMTCMAIPVKSMALPARRPRKLGRRRGDQRE